MTPERWQKVKEIFQAAIDRASGERSAFLEGVCGGDEALRQEVESLIASHEKDGSFIDSPAYQAAAELLVDEKAELKPGQIIGSYEITSFISRGGMGEVYLAQDTKLKRKVALKILPSMTRGDTLAQKRLLREAQTAATLDHPNICSIYEVGEDHGRSFIAMQYIDGETLAARMARAKLSPSEALDIAVQIADALAEAHSLNLVHRDIKPSNVMITTRGQVKVLDFGLARTTGAASASEAETKSMLSTPGMILGTVPYMSPEQVRGEHVDARTDVFSFGAVLYEMLTGKRPFAQNTAAETIGAILHTEPRPLSSIDPTVPGTLENIVANCLVKEKERRYQDMREVANDLKAAQTGELAVTRLVPNRVYDAKQVRTRRWYAALAGVAALLVLATIVFGIYRWRTAAATSTAAIDSVAVLPLLNSSGDSNKDYLSDGISESLIGSLSQLPNLKVISRNSSFKFRAQEADAQTIARKLGVRGVVTGNVRQLDDNLVIYIELIDANDGTAVFNQTYIRKASDLLSMQSNIAQDVAGKMRLKLSPDDRQHLAKLPTSSNEAYQLYLKGKARAGNQSQDGHREALKYYQQAIEADPNFALAYAMMSVSYVELGAYFEAPKDTMPQARRLAEKAVELDNSLADAHAALGIVHLLYDWDYAAAEHELMLSGKFNPNAAETFSCAAHILESTGHFKEAETEVRNALASDPLSTVLHAELGCTSYYARQFDEAISEERATLQMDPLDPIARWNLARALNQKQQYQDAIDEVKKHQAVNGETDPLLLSELAYAYARMNKTEQAQAGIRTLNEMSKRAFIDPYLFASIYAGMGDKEQTLAWLNKAYEAKSAFLVSAKAEPKFDIVAGDPRFAKLLKQIGFVA